jgi:integrase
MASLSMTKGGAVLTAKKVERVKAPGRYHDGHGLYLQVRNASNKSWLLRFERDGRERWLGLGPTHVFSLKEARERAREARQLLHDGIDPIDHRRAERVRLAAVKARAITFREAAQRYFDQHESKWRNRKHAAQFLWTLETYARPILDMSVADIATTDVLRCIEPHWLAKTETMQRTRGRIERVLDWCKVRGYRSGDNPAAWKGHLCEVLPARGQVAKVEHHPALPYTEAADFIAKLRERDGMAARALEFLILTVARTGEVLGASWNEIEWDARMWVVPADRMKGGREHRVALSERAIELLRELPKDDGNDFVFIGSRPGAGLAKQGMVQVLARMGRTDVSVHGFRSTFRDWAAERTNFPRELAELALAHRVADKTERAYQRSDMLKKRFALADAWARYCSTPSVVAAGETVVVPMHQGRP